MSPLRRLRIRLRMASGHRPFWIEVEAGAALLAWGSYVLLLPIPLGHVPAWTGVLHLASPNATMGGPAVLIGLLQLAAAFALVRPARIIAALATAGWFALAAVISGATAEPHPGITLYWAQSAAAAWAVPWLVYDLLRRR